ncbi:hypothetical protein GCK72_015893 [Caenorhabditis remanei]|uniref:Uncharacterized protein n=1 Tax=Caenorhabditis remanei TaxID=31234 RepID=A0A6A5GXR3_CAERE|nr:hypothetical protein GCK72_015893 [Caenorhabditis remanei]KAF1759426.1 hypothetical protein GCK72_015893 [Caenorhabditis remanei]
MDASKIRAIQSVQLQYDCARYKEKIQELYAQRDFYMEKLGATETANQKLEKQNVELIGQLEKMNMAMQELVKERDSNKTKIQVTKDDAESSNDDKNRVDMIEQPRKKKPTMEEVIRKANLICGKKRLSDTQKNAVKSNVLQEEQSKNQGIQDLATRLSGAEQQTGDKIMELTNELKKKDEVVHIELGRLYLELQEAKKPQEALMARLAAKDKGIEYLTKQHEEKLAAKDSEIQNLTIMVQEGGVKNKNHEEMIANLRKVMFTMQWQMEEMRTKFNAERQAALQDPTITDPKASIEYEDSDDEW